MALNISEICEVVRPKWLKNKQKTWMTEDMGSNRVRMSNKESDDDSSNQFSSSSFSDNNEESKISLDYFTYLKHYAYLVCGK